MTPAIFEILKEVSELKRSEEKIKCLQKHESAPLKAILKGTFCPSIQWDLPEGTPPYKPNDGVGFENALLSQTKKFYLFIKGLQPAGLRPIKKEALFIEMLENVHPKDAEIIIAMKDKKSPMKGITEDSVKKAFPGLIDEPVRTPEPQEQE